MCDNVSGNDYSARFAAAIAGIRRVDSCRLAWVVGPVGKSTVKSGSHTVLNRLSTSLLYVDWSSVPVSGYGLLVVRMCIHGVLCIKDHTD